MNADKVAAQKRLPLCDACFITEAASFRRVDHHLLVVRLDIEDLFGQQADGLSVRYETDGFLGGGEAFLQITRQCPVSDEQAPGRKITPMSKASGNENSMLTTIAAISRMASIQAAMTIKDFFIGFSFRQQK